MGRFLFEFVEWVTYLRDQQDFLDDRCSAGFDFVHPGITFREIHSAMNRTTGQQDNRTTGQQDNRTTGQLSAPRS
jgi:hypothetical protein